MSDFILTQVINFGVPLIGLILLLGALGLPVGGSIVVIAAGAFSQQGILNWYSVVAIGLASAVLGDVLSYGMGYFAKNWVEKRFGSSQAWLNAGKSFRKSAGLAIYLTRWLVTAVAVPVNLIAGGSDLKFSQFLLFDVTGELTWLVLYGGLGYWFGSEWELVYDFISNFGGLLLGLVILGFGVHQIWGWQKRKQSAANSLQESQST
jgi:membrane-associated protein